jgi:FixJ family two-component response regulator
MNEDSVVVVDGDPAVRDSLSTLLDLNGYQVQSFATGAAFLKQLDGGASIECVVCEADLPDTDGIQIYRQLRSKSDTPFALLVSRRNANVIRLAREAGIEQVFLKPLVHRRLIEFISRKPDERKPD